MKTTKTVFISYSHKDEELMQQVESHLKAININADIWMDKSKLDAGDKWEDKIKNAIDKSNIAIVLISADFLNSDFIAKKEMPWLERRNYLHDYRIVPFILRPSNLDKFSFLEKLEGRPKEKSLIEYKEDNGDREIILKDFAQEIKKLTEENNKIPKEQENQNLFCKTFAIFRVLELHNKNEEFYFRLTSDLKIYKQGKENPIEIWKFMDKIESVQEYGQIMFDLFDKKNPDITIGIIQKNSLSSSFRGLSSFLDALKFLRKDDESTRSICSPFYNQQDIATFVSTFHKGNNKNASDLNSDTSTDIESLFFFQNFNIYGYTNNELRTKVFNFIENKFEVRLTDNTTEIFGLKPFLNVFKEALDYMDANIKKSINFNMLLSLVEVLDLPLKHINNLNFIKNNKKLIECNISNSVDISISKLYVQSKAKFYYQGSDENYENINSLSDWVKDQIDSKDFLILLGDFGHGKTTFFKYMTTNLSNKYENGNYIPVYLPLRKYFTKNDNLKNAVASAVMPNNKMTNEFWNNNKWLIFCDGFDELNIYHQNEPNWITLVFSMLLNQSKKSNIKIILSSRPVLFLDPNVKKDTVNKFNRLILKPFDESKIEQWLNNWSKCNKPITINDIKQRNLLEVSQTPVILFLLAIIFHTELSDKNIKYTKSQIYKKFFDWTAKSGGYISSDENVKHIVPSNYREILQEIAHQIFIHPDAISGMLNYDILLEQIKEIFDDISLTNSLSNEIFVAHAFKESKPEHIEFIHQSLREYLVAEKIFDTYYNFYIVNFENSGVCRFKYDELILIKPITQAKLYFFRDMIESLNSEDKEKLSKINYFSFNATSINEYFIEKDSKKFFKFLTYSENKILTSTQHGIFDSIIGNIAILDFLFQIYIKQDVDFLELNKIISFYNSDNRYNGFLEVLQKSLIKMIFFQANIESINFDYFMLENSQYLDTIFKDCSFEHSSFNDSLFCASGAPTLMSDMIEIEEKKRGPTEFKNCKFSNIELFNTKFQAVIFSNCTFYNYEGANGFSQEDVKYNDCQFYESTLHYEFFKGTTFNNCIFLKSQFVDMQNEKAHKTNFYNCIMKKNAGKWVKVDNNIWKT